MGKQLAGYVLLVLIFAGILRLLLPHQIGVQEKEILNAAFEKQREIMSVMGSSLTELIG